MFGESWRERYLKPGIIAGLVVIAYATALNRMQTLPWVIAAALLATAIVGIALPYWLVSRVRIERSGPSRAEEGQTIHFDIRVENRGFLPRFMVELTDKLPFLTERVNAAGEHVLGIVSYAPPRGMSQFSMPMLCETRGFYKLGPVGLQSSFPLGLAEARVKTNGGVQNLTIYPDVFPIISMPLHGAPSQIHRGGYLLPKGTGAAEFAGLREYRRGDHPRFIHWPTTARLNELMVKEFEPLASASIYVILDLAKETNVGQGREATAEYAIRIAASIAQFSCLNNIPVRLGGQGRRPFDISSGSGEYHYQRTLDELAIVDVNGGLPYANVLQQLALNCSYGETVVVFISQKDQEADAVIESLATLRSRGVHLHVVVFDRGSFSDKLPDTTAATQNIMAKALALDAYCIPVKCGDDLQQLFNS